MGKGDYLARFEIDENVVEMTIAETNHVANHGCDGQRTARIPRGMK